ncbi:MAG: hypothetical protein QN168_05750 [Armatimonadota bacterium]|nr:hypothetical protein [Armatimonadota bacterium]
MRLGWALPPLRPALPAAHGPLMVAGFPGALIGLERAVAVGSRWAYGAPFLTALGTLGLLIVPDDMVTPLSFTAGSLGLAAIFAVIVRRQPTLATFTMALGAVAWVAGDFLWLVGAPVRAAVPLWGAFLVLTIAGERLELGRIARLSPWSEIVFRGAVMINFGASLFAGIGAPAGMRVVGLGKFVLALWLLRYDIARYTVKQRGPMRFFISNAAFWTCMAGHLGRVVDGLRRDFDRPPV